MATSVGCHDGRGGQVESRGRRGLRGEVAKDLFEDIEYSWSNQCGGKLL